MVIFRFQPFSKVFELLCKTNSWTADDGWNLHEQYYLSWSAVTCKKIAKYLFEKEPASSSVAKGAGGRGRSCPPGRILWLSVGNLLICNILSAYFR